MHGDKKTPKQKWNPSWNWKPTFSGRGRVGISTSLFFVTRFWFNLFTCFRSILVFYFFLSNFYKLFFPRQCPFLLFLYLWVSGYLFLIMYIMFLVIFICSLWIVLFQSWRDVFFLFFLVFSVKDCLFLKSFQRTYFFLPWLFFPLLPLF